MLPLRKAAAASGGARSMDVMSFSVRPAFRNALTVTLWALEPRLKATFLPLRSASVLSGESFCTRIADPPAAPL
ncbi:hypothetical protein D3C87_2111340 [compost metagenome]